MSSERIETGKAPSIVIHCRGDLQIAGWSEGAVLVKGDSAETASEEKGLSIESGGDLKLKVPVLSSVAVAQVNGDMLLKSIDGDVVLTEVNGDALLQTAGQVEVITVLGDLAGRNINGTLLLGEVHGDASLRSVSELTIGKIHGDCFARNVNGSVRLEHVMGDLSLSTVNGDVNIREGCRDVNLRNLGGVVHVSQTHGDIRLSGSLAAGKHNLTADGDIVLRWPSDAPMNVQASAPEIQNRLSLEDLSEEEGYLSGRIGDSETHLILNSSGRIILKELQPAGQSWDQFMTGEFDMEFGLGDLDEHIADMSSRMSELSARLEKNFGPEFAATLEKKAQEAAARAEKAAERAVRKAEKAANKVRWQFEQDDWAAPSPAKHGQRERAQDNTKEEQLEILRMVEKGIISPDEANTLLEALGT